MRSFLFKAFCSDGGASTSLQSEERIMYKQVLIQSTPKPAARWLTSVLGALALGFGFAGVASAADVYLKAQSYTKTITLPDASTVNVPMWGFASCTDNTFASCTLDANLSGPQINVDLASDTALTIYLNNALSVPVSIVIPGQAGGGDPVKVADAKGRMRMQSMTHETAAGAIGTYTWNALQPGTYLYHSGTRPSIQVAMGLYGALVVVNGTQAYPGVSYDQDAVLLFSEIDPLQNQRVVDSGVTTPTEACVKLADYRKSGTVGYPCTIDYNPIYFMVNGQTSASNSLPGTGTGAAAQNVLLRFLNAGLRTHTPAFIGVELNLVAEDGHPYPGLSRKQATALLTAGKTLDAVVVTPADTNVTWSLFDHMPSFNNEAAPNGGALANLLVGTGTPPAPPATTYAVNDAYAVTEDTSVTAAVSVLANDVNLAGATVTVAKQTVNGTLGMNPDGTFTYTPNANFSGTDSFTYNATLNGESYPALVTLNVSFVNDAPVAAADAYSNSVGTAITVDAAHGVLGNDTDVDGDTLTAVIEGAAPAGLTLNPDGSFAYSGGTATTFSYRASDGATTSDPVTVTLSITQPANVNLSVQEFGTNLAVTSYRWIVQEDRTYHLDPNNPQNTAVLDQQALNFHKSSMPVIAQGCTDCNPSSTPFNQVALDPSKYYYVSVLPNDAGTGQGHSIGGAQILPGQTSVTVIVNKQEIPTAQISVSVFEDSWPTNGAIDGNEHGLGGFTITLEDAGGRYGISGGTMLQDAFGNPLKNSLDCFGGVEPPRGVIESCPDTPANQAAGLVGEVLIKDLPPGKYGVIAVPPASQKTWTQTSTIEGTKVIDAWVKANEPAYFVEFGLAGPHAFIGFARPETSCMGAAPCQVPAPVDGTPLYSISGNVTLLHDPRPPLAPLSVDSGSYNGLAYTRAWIGLNSDAGIGPSIATLQADPDGHFTIPNVPNGTYQVVIWDTYLDQIISYQTANVADGNVALGNVGVPAWFTRSEHNVFLDDGCAETTGAGIAGDGIRQPCEAGLPDQAINLRWRDGTVNQSFPTDTEGYVPFDQTFPFFSWQILEVDYTRFKPTGVTVTVDAGGGPLQDPFILKPQIQDPALFTADNEACTDASCQSRTETGSGVLLEAFQGLPGQTLKFDWGKVPYKPGENGGISGIVFYSSTRGEGDPRLTVGDPWEPGIAKVKMRLYRVISRDPAQVDTNVEPLDDFPGPGDIDVNGNGQYDGPEVLTLVKEVQTDSWDDAIPTGCQGEKRDNPADDALAAEFYNKTLTANGTQPENLGRCYDGFRNWNQVRPGVFDGGYAFNDIPPGKYVVEAILPPGYEQYKEQDMNVGFGDAFGSNLGPAPVSVTLPNGSLVLVVPDQAMVQAAKGPEPGLAQPPCVGKYHQVPDELSLFPGEAAPFAGAWRPLCDRKEVILSDQGQAAADFHLFTSTPVAAQFTGLVTDDLSLETNLTSPSYGEKWSPAYMPFTIRDFNGTVVYSGLGDAFGRYNGMIPSTFTANVPIPSGYSPSMMQACLNESGATKNYRYLAACYTGQFMPGTNTYLDTPILPSAAFAGGYNPPDCAAANGTPVIAEVNSVAGTAVGFGPLVSRDGMLEIKSLGTAVTVPNPDYEGPLAAAPHNVPTITRNFGFGTEDGTVTLVYPNGTQRQLSIDQWSANTIRAEIPGNTPYGEAQLVVTNRGGNSTSHAVTVTITRSNGAQVETPIRVPGNYATIQAAIDAANPGALILVAPGTYHEQVIMWKPVRLQGTGSTTVIDAIMTGAADLQIWRDKLAAHLPDVDLLPGTTTISEEGAGITVLAKSTGPSRFQLSPSRIDGFTITNASGGGAILVNGYANNLEIANNDITGNSGQLHGGIRIGQPFLQGLTPNGNGVVVLNDNVNIHNNAITLNGALFNESAGSGISISSGSRNYTVARNFICGNYTAGDGAGIGHTGISQGGSIVSNRILYNQAYNVGFTTHGGGIFISGNSAVNLGSGNVTIDSNLIQGNNAGSGSGGGIRTQLVNGPELALHNPWRILMTNNMIVNNVAAWSGGGISLQDTVNAVIVNNTIANNDTTATEGSLVINNNSSAPQPAGMVAETNSIALQNAVITLGNAAFNATFSDPRLLLNNIIWHNRAFHLGPLANNTVGLLPELAPASVGGCAGGANYWDLGVLGQPQAGATLKLDPRQSILSSTTEYPGFGNRQGDPDFLAAYCNGARTLSAPGPILAILGVGEGGNFVDVRYGPLTPAWPAASTPWNYHIGANSDGLNNANSTNGNVPDHDIDGNTRPQGSGVDRGADERL
ncbi:MAG: hypothetical protein GC149_14415 [Gammaproteobacteria bacterium]|nr:hypothetical protein [Gammaproteobacteria bacterium]